MNPATIDTFRNSSLRLFRDYGMLVVLVLLCAFFSIVTMSEQHLEGEDAAAALLPLLEKTCSPGASILLIGRSTSDDSLFIRSLQSRLAAQGSNITGIVTGNPATIRAVLSQMSDSGLTVQVIAAPRALLPVLNAARAQSPRLASAALLTPPPERWPTFLLADNLRNIANQISVIAILAIGMTMVIVAGGIDLSVGSLIALSAVVAAWFIGALGGTGATTVTLWLSCAAAIAVCGAIGAFSGWMITSFRIPPFIATLAMMQVAAGLA